MAFHDMRIEGFDVGELLKDDPVKVGIGGFSMGAAMVLYSATAYALGRYGNGNPYPINLKAVVRLSRWLSGLRGLRNIIEVSHEARRRATSLPIMLSHGTLKLKPQVERGLKHKFTTVQIRTPSTSTIHLSLS
ncbi:hypothetical protein PTKIN_Ptkin05aG0137700 [Pterospermum kingtungense]